MMPASARVGGRLSPKENSRPMPAQLDNDNANPPPIEPLETVADLVEIAGQLGPSNVVVVGGDRLEDLRLVESARDHGIIDRLLLVGNRERIERAVGEVKIDIDWEDVTGTDGEEQTAAATVEIIRKGAADIVLKGNISTPIINRHMLPLSERRTVSLATVFDASAIGGGRPIVMTDAGVTTVCNFGRMVDLVRNAVDVARTVMGIARPRVAILSANEKQIPSLRSTSLAAELSRRDWPDAVVYGPLSFDLATDPESVAVKGLPDVPAATEVAGRADVVVCPGIDSANVLYKTLTALSKFGEASLASITVGFPVPYIILSRADALSTRLESIALCNVYSRRHRAAAAPTVKPPARQPELPRRVLVVNPGSTSMKVAVFENDLCLHDSEGPCELDVAAGADLRRQVEQLAGGVLAVLKQSGAEPIDAVVGRGGFLPRPAAKLPAGAYVVAEREDGGITVHDGIVSAVLDRPEKPHASNLGIPLAAALAERLGVPAYAVDPVVVDEFRPEAEVSGYAPVARRSTSHALSVRAAARRAAEAIGRPIEDVNLVVAHLGGGITVAAVRGGKMVDNTIALLGGGPFTPQRAGQLPLMELIDLCYSGRFTREGLLEELTKRGGLRSYLGTDRMEEIEQRIADGDEAARLVVDAMVYQIGKEIGSQYVAAGCDVEAIVLTGGLARSDLVRSGIRRQVGRLAPVMVFPGSLEMAALAAGAIDALAGRCQPYRYVPPPPE